MSEVEVDAVMAGGSAEELAERIFGGVLGMIDMQMIYIGERLGLYSGLAQGDATAPELSHATDCDARYVREWLEQQAVAGVLEVDDPELAPCDRRYRLPAAGVEVLTGRDGLSYLAPFARMMVGVARQLPAVLEAFRIGEGVPYANYDLDFCEGQAELNRTMFVNLLAQEWLPAIADVHERLLADPPARVADLGCGAGHSTLAIVRGYPVARVEGVDVDPASIELARLGLAASGLGDRVSFELRDAAELNPAQEGAYDLVTVFEAVHDLPRPVDFLCTARRMLAPGGCVLVADERVAERFAAPGDDVERLMYGYSVMHCLPVARCEEPSAMTGTVMRPDVLRAYASDAGFSGVEILPIENDFWRFYRLDP